MNSTTQTMSNVNNEKEAFLNINQQAFIELLTFIDFADNRLNIGFVEIKFSQDRDILINALLEHPDCNNIQFEVLDFSDPNLRFLRDELVTALKHINLQANKKLILLITGLEKSIGIVEEYPSVLTNLNFVRDDLRTSIPHPMLLFLPDYALTRLAKYAPDFWAWGRKLFTFKTNRSSLITNSNNIIFSDDYIHNLDLAKKQARIEQLLSLLSEYNTSTDEKTKNDLLTISNIYNQLGNGYDALGQYQKAIIVYEKSLESSGKIQDRQAEGNSLRGLGNAYHALGQYQKAISFHQKSIEVFREIGDKQGEAISLGNLGSIYQSLGEYQQAMIFHQKNLDIARKINYKLGEAISLGNLGESHQFLGQYQKGIVCQQESLDIARKIQYRRGEAKYLQSLGNAYQALGEYQEAINYYQQSLGIARKIQYRRGEAITWFNLGLTFKNIQRHDDAIEAFRNARKLFQDMGLNQKVENCDNEIKILENDIHF